MISLWVPAPVALVVLPSAASEGHAQMAAVLGRVTLSFERRGFVPNHPAAPFPYWLSRRGYPHPRLVDRPYLPGDFATESTRIDPSMGRVLRQTVIPI